MQQFGEMLTTSTSQYIHPDYLNPLPTTLDAKKSPLALLAQTCSSIGKDSTSTKSLIPPLEKKDSEKQQLEKSTSIENEKKDGKTRDSDETKDKPGFRTISHKDVPPLVPVSRSKEEKLSSPLKSSPRPKEISANSSSSSHSEHTSSRSVTSQSPGSRHSGSDKEDDKIKRHRDSPSRPARVSSSHLDNCKTTSSASYSSYSDYPSVTAAYPHFAHAGHGLSAEAAAHLSGFPYNLHANAGLSSAAAAAALAAQSSALAAQSSALKSAYGASLSHYVSYARVRTPSGATTLVPVCRDPYCTNCQLTVQNSHLSSTCTAVGCAQCAHEKALQNLSLGLHGSSFPHLPPSSYSASGLLSSTPSSLGSHFLSSSLYPPSSLSAAHSGMPFVCNWVSSGNEHCGKRFSTSEELLQHLRTHTTSSDPLSLAAAYERYGIPPSNIPGLSHLGLSSPGSLSPNSLRRNYPTSVSPLSGLMGANRYHPYKSLLAPPSGLSSQQLPSIGPYFSPYSLYGQRIGAAAVP